MAVPEPAPSPEAEARACLNCGEPLLGPFCWSCGQEDVDLHRPLKQLAQDAVGDLLNLDTRLLRTLGPLFFRPGVLTREYLAGRRVQLVPPLKMFLLASLVFFGLTALLPHAKFGDFQVNSTPGARSSDDSNFDRRLGKAIPRAQENPEAFAEAVRANLDRAFFVLLPFFALLLKLFYWRQNRYYLDHLIFALYQHSFAFLVLSLLAVLARPGMPFWLQLLLFDLHWLWIFAYLFVALRRVYGGTRWRTLFKLSGLLGIYCFALLATMMLMVMVTLWWF